MSSKKKKEKKRQRKTIINKSIATSHKIKTETERQTNAKIRRLISIPAFDQMAGPKVCHNFNFLIKLFF
jgi:hypothetical protein